MALCTVYINKHINIYITSNIYTTQLSTTIYVYTIYRYIPFTIFPPLFNHTPPVSPSDLTLTDND